MILVSGASGFIGQNLLTAIPQTQGVSLRNDGWRDTFAEASSVINLVGKAHDHKGTATEADYHHANVQLAKDVFAAFAASSAHLLIHVSSIAAVEEYESAVPLTEKDHCHPQTCYGQSKRAAEEWLLAQTLPAGKKLIILRPPMVHGPSDKGNLGLLYKFVSKGIPYPLAAFNNQRSFISIDNLIYLLMQLLEKQDTVESGIYHIADDQPVSTNEIITLIGETTGKRPSKLAVPKGLVRMGAKVGDIFPLPLNTKRLRKMTSDFLVSNTKIKAALGVESLPISAREGLLRTLRSF